MADNIENNNELTELSPSEYFEQVKERKIVLLMKIYRKYMITVLNCLINTKLQVRKRV